MIDEHEVPIQALAYQKCFDTIFLPSQAGS